MNGMNRTICCLSPVMKVGLKISSPIRRNSALGFVKDSPSIPKATAATTYTESFIGLEKFPTSGFTYVGRILRRQLKAIREVNENTATASTFALHLSRRTPSWTTPGHSRCIPSKSSQYCWCRGLRFELFRRRTAVPADPLLLSTPHQEQEMGWRPGVDRALKKIK